MVEFVRIPMNTRRPLGSLTTSATADKEMRNELCSGIREIPSNTRRPLGSLTTSATVEKEMRNELCSGIRENSDESISKASEVSRLPLRMAVLFGLIMAAASVSAAERPNIVFLFTDDQTTYSLGCYGNKD